MGKSTCAISLLGLILACTLTCNGEYILELTSSGVYDSPSLNRLYLDASTTTILCRLSGTVSPISTPAPPIVMVWNSTWCANFTFTIEQPSQWQLVLSRKDLGLADEVEQWWPKEEWRLKINMTVDGNLVTGTASLLDKLADVFLRWTMGTAITSLPASLTSPITRIHQSPCAPDVAVFALQSQASEDFFVAQTFGSFQAGAVTWFQLTSVDVCSSVCSASTQLVDVVLTNHYLLVLTTAGLHRSNDLRGQPPATGTNLTFETLFTVADHTSSLQNVYVSYSKTCLLRQYDLQTTRGDVITITMEETGGATRSFYSVDPFTVWRPTDSRMSSVSILDSCHNLHIDSLALLVKNQSDFNSVEVIRLKADASLADRGYFQPYTFPATAQLTRLQILPISQFIYAFGNEVWVSEDGGNTFNLIHSLTGDTVVSITSDLYQKTLIMETTSGSVLFGRPGIHRLVALTSSITPSTTGSLIDALSRIIYVTLTISSTSVTAVTVQAVEELENINSTFPNPLGILFLSHQNALLFEYSPSTPTPSALTSLSIGKEIAATDGGTATILDIRNKRLMSGFVSAATVKITSMWYRDSDSVGPQKHTLSVTYLDHSAGTATLTLTSLVDASEGWTAGDLHKTVVIPGTTSFLITSITSISAVEASAVMYVSGTILRYPRSWYVIDLGVVSGDSTWKLREPACTHKMILNPELEYKSLFELDLHESFSAAVLLNISDTTTQERPPRLFATLSNPWLFKSGFNWEFIHRSNQRKMNVTLESYYFRRGVTAVRFQVNGSSLLCEDPLHTVQVYAGCPCQKRLLFIYPYNVTIDQSLYGFPAGHVNASFLKELVANYRPPSRLGVGIPTSAYIYNADPQRNRPHNVFGISKNTGELNRCKGAGSRLECGCTKRMKLSPDPQDTDCKERVIRIHHPGVLMTRFIVRQPERTDFPLSDSFLVNITEINDRAPKIDRKSSATSPLPELLKGLRNDSRFPNARNYFNPNTLQVVMNGSGLYHYRADVIPGLSFCQLTVHFQLYVDQTPIAYPLQYILNFSTSIVFGGFFFVLYLWYSHSGRKRPTRRMASSCRHPFEVENPIHIPKC